MHKINQRLGKDNRKYELCLDDQEILRDLKNYIPNLMNRLWELPKTVVSVIENASKENLKEHLAPLFANNFYENILSSYYIEDNLIYVLYLLLHTEINKLNNFNQIDKFLDETPCGILLGELRRRSDIQSFFKNIIIKAIENLEANNSMNKIYFDLDNMISFYTKTNSRKNEEAYLNDLSGDNDDSDDDDIFGDGVNIDKKKDNDEQGNFNQKYIPYLDKKSLLKLIEENKNDKEKYDYLSSKLSFFTNDENIFSNERLLDFLNRYKHPNKLLYLYRRHFMIVVNFIDQIINNILENIHLAPYSIKCICRIISELIIHKFPTITIHQKSAFISKFLFEKLLIPILMNPGVEVFVNNFICENTYYNLKEISSILKKFVSCNFYTSKDNEFNYTPFNWYYIKNIKNIFKISKEIIKVRFPLFIENLINNKLPKDYEYNYFKENPDEFVNFRSILFNMEQISALIETMDAHEKEIFKDDKCIKIQKALEKLLLGNNQKIMKGIINSEKIDEKKDNKKDKNKKKDKDKKKKDDEEKINEKKVHYFLITNLDLNQTYEELLSIKQKTNFSLEEIKNPNDEESLMKNKIIKVKNFFFSLLYNYHKLIKTDFDEGKIENTEKILNELNIFMKSSNFVMDGSIPSEWYVKSLLEYLKNIPENLTKNDCEELYNEMKEDINKSIKRFDFEALSVIMGKLKFANRSKMYYKNCIKLLEDIKSNEDIRKIITELYIPVEIKFHYDSKEEKGLFNIDISKFKEKDFNNEEKIKKYENSNKIKLCPNIKSFTEKFPNLVRYQTMQDVDIFDMQEKLKFPQQIYKYIDIIKCTLKKCITENIDSVIEKIYDYIMVKLYDKIYPIEPCDEDTKIFQKSVILSWIQPKHFLKSNKEFVFGSFENDVLEYFKLLDKEKSPKKKIINMGGIFSLIGFLLKFNGKVNDRGVDDEIPILSYASIKAQTLRIFSNVKFMELYIGEQKSKKEGNQLSQFKGICELIPKINYTNLNDVTLEEFNEMCNNGLKDVKPN